MRGQKRLPEGYPGDLSTLGSQLRKERMDLGLSQRQLAELLKVHKGSIDKWERHVVQPSARMAARVIRFLDVDRTRVGD